MVGLIIWGACAALILFRRVIGSLRGRPLWCWETLVALVTAPVVCLLAAVYGLYDWGTSERVQQRIAYGIRLVTEEEDDELSNLHPNDWEDE